MEKIFLMEESLIGDFLEANNFLKIFTATGLSSLKNDISLKIKNEGYIDLSADNPYRPYVVEQGVAVIPVKGSLVKSLEYHIENYSTGYKYIKDAYTKAMDDDSVVKVILDINSPGGEAAGNFDLVDYMKAYKKKEVTAQCSDYVCSGAYSIATVADSIKVETDTVVGSIGVISIHFEVSELLKRMGINPTVTRRAEGKANVNIIEKLSDDAKKDIDISIENLYNDFVSLVSSNRNITEERVRNTNSKVFRGRESVSLGLSDIVTSLKDTITYINREEKMEKENKESLAIDIQSELTKARIEERVRIQSILNCEEAEGREELAKTLAFNTQENLSLETVVSILKASPKAEEVKQTVEIKQSSHLEGLMESEKINLTTNEQDTFAKVDTSKMILANAYAGESNIPVFNKQS